MKVWIDQDRCTGDAQCVEICPEVFFMHDGGQAPRAFVRVVGQPGAGPDGSPLLRTPTGRADVPPSLEDAVAEAVDFCPADCIGLDDGGT